MIEADVLPTSLSILLFSSAYNAMTQHIERTLKNRGHFVYFQIAQAEECMRQAVNQYQPNIIICPMLMKAIPKDIYERIICLIVHPGVKGDRGPSALDWAILQEKREWGVTIIQASQEMDAGDVWATGHFVMPQNASKIFIYHSEVCPLAEKLILECIEKYQKRDFIPEPLHDNDPSVIGGLHQPIKQADAQRQVNWEKDHTHCILKKIRAADGQPGAKVELMIGNEKIIRLAYGVTPEAYLQPLTAMPGEVVGRRDHAICVATQDGAIWISALRSLKTEDNLYPLKLPAIIQLGKLAHNIPIKSLGSVVSSPDEHTYQEISFERIEDIGVLYFDFYNGAMSTEQCKRLLIAIQQCTEDKTLKAFILAGSERNWSNGIHLNVIEHAHHPMEESWENIIAINAIIKHIIISLDILTVSAIRANAGAGGVYLALASDFVFAKPGVVLNPHYKNMGLFGSELHTFTAIKKIGHAKLTYLKESAHPFTVAESIQFSLIDDVDAYLKDYHDNTKGFLNKVIQFTQSFINNPDKLNHFLMHKKESYHAMTQHKTLEEFENDELREMYADIFQDRNGYHTKRKLFVRKVKESKIHTIEVVAPSQVLQAV